MLQNEKIFTCRMKLCLDISVMSPYHFRTNEQTKKPMNFLGTIVLHELKF